jgi:hypothetical protein
MSQVQKRNNHWWAVLGSILAYLVASAITTVMLPFDRFGPDERLIWFFVRVPFAYYHYLGPVIIPACFVIALCAEVMARWKFQRGHGSRA